MTPGRRSALRWAAWVAGAAVALGSTFTLGVVAGAGSTESSAPSSPALLDEAAREIAEDGLHPVDRSVLDAAAIKAMLQAADDQWGSWGDGASSRGSYAGVGLWLRRSGTSLRVAQVAAGGPAEDAGVQVGDEVLSVDGRAADGLSAEDAAAALRGRAGTPVRLTLSRGGSVQTLSLRRAVVAAPEVTTAMVTSQVGQIVVPVFSTGVGRQVRQAARALVAQHATALVLDLRGNPGGLLSEAVETASAFLDGGAVVTYTRRDELAQRLDAAGRGDTATPLVVLVDGSTASAAEVVAGALQDRGRAVVVGSRTFGKGTVQEPHRLADGSSLALTVARYTLPSGRSVEGVGIEPDIQVVDGAAALHRAVEVLSGLLADTGGGRG
ncbi:MAG TPA: S41 family peptidase [Mycobacteriales bacterium]|nr:S41 family peptidase [Mycobacteriales bacterium]